jgi:SAM-dependent methyltransferase
MVIAQADNRNATSAAMRFRHRRMAAFSELLQPTTETTILDLGGTPGFWSNFNMPGRVTVLNLSPSNEFPAAPDCTIGDARDLSRYDNESFDIVFSNSVIEHVGGPDDQEAMAREARRVGKAYFIQTPNRSFPVEPHFLFPGMQFMPRPLRRTVARYWPLGWYKPNSPEALADANGIRMLTAAEMHTLFSEAWILGERFAGLIKSLIAVTTDREPSMDGFRVLHAPYGCMRTMPT